MERKTHEVKVKSLPCCSCLLILSQSISRMAHWHCANRCNRLILNVWMKWQCVWSLQQSGPLHRSSSSLSEKPGNISVSSSTMNNDLFITQSNNLCTARFFKSCRILTLESLLHVKSISPEIASLVIAVVRILGDVARTGDTHYNVLHLCGRKEALI